VVIVASGHPFEISYVGVFRALTCLHECVLDLIWEYAVVLDGSAFRIVEDN
jgi:hypothetical protein